jgi:HlyD family secretion protein
MRELKDEVERKQSAVLAKKATWELEQSKAKKLERQIAACNIKAHSDGVLVYANDPSRAFGSNRPQIEEGATVRERQKIFSLPDVTRMQVKTKVHESQVDKLASRMKARIRVDAFANEVLNGTVHDISPLPDSTNFFSSDIKVYTTKVTIDQPLRGLRPGMTAQVEILVSELDNVLSVPVEAIVQYDNKDHVAVKKADGSIELRAVTLGLSNGRTVEVKQGIMSGEIVVIKPLTLLNAEQKGTIKNSPAPPATAPNGP